MSKIIYDLIQRFEVENGVPRLISTNIQVIEGGDDLLSLAISMLEKLGFYEKFEENRTSQYIGYRFKNPSIGGKRYQLVLAQRKDGLCISIPRNIFTPYLLELDFSSENLLTDAQKELFKWLVDYISNEKRSPSIREMMQAMNVNSPAPIQSRLEHLHTKGYIYWTEEKANTIKIRPSLKPLFWVRSSQNNIFHQISNGYSDILNGKTQGKFNLNEVRENHLDYLIRLSNDECCLNIYEDTLFPYSLQVCITSSEILKEFLGYFGKIFMEQQ